MTQTADHSLYNIHRGPAGFTIGKFDSGLNLLAAYDVDPKHCTCPAGPRPSCRHRKMLPRMLAKVNTPEFYCYETNTWHRPLDPRLSDGLLTSTHEAIEEATTLLPSEARSSQGQGPEVVAGEQRAGEAEAQPPAESELYSSMSPARKELLEEAQAMNKRLEEKTMAQKIISSMKEMEAVGIPDPEYVLVPDPNPVRIPTASPSTIRRR